MKQSFLLLFLMSLSWGSVCSQSSAPGYYISNQKDTVSAHFKIKKGVFGQITNDFINEAEIIEENNETRKIKPTDVSEYGFTMDNTQYRFYSKPTKNGTNKFLASVFKGPKSSLYQYGIITSGSLSTRSNQVFYTFEKADGTYLFLKNTLNKKFRDELKEFYKDNMKAQAMMDNKLKYWDQLQKDLKLILIAANTN